MTAEERRAIRERWSGSAAATVVLHAHSEDRIRFAAQDTLTALDALEACERELRLCRELLRRAAQGDPNARWAAAVYLNPQLSDDPVATDARLYVAALRTELEVDRG